MFETYYRTIILYIYIYSFISKCCLVSYFFIKLIMDPNNPWESICCNPFRELCHENVRIGLRRVSAPLREKFPSLPTGSKLCNSCRKKLGSVSVLPDPPQLSSSSSDEDIQEPPLVPIDENVAGPSGVRLEQEVALASLNQTLGLIGQSPVIIKKLSQQKYPKEKSHRVKKALKRIIDENPDSDSSSSDQTGGCTDCEILNQLKEKFHSTKDRSLQVQILTLLPKSWTIPRIELEFKTSNYMARKAKHLVKEKGVMSSPNPRPGKPLSDQVVLDVKSFYQEDDISRAMPGAKDFVSVKQADGKRIHLHKRLVLSNLREIYSSFKIKYPEHKIGFSKFADLRPAQCVLPGASGTHAVCVCTIHQNVKLMLLGAKIADLTKDSDGTTLKTYHDCLSEMICTEPRPHCYLGECPSCPGTSDLKSRLRSIMDDNMIEEIRFKKWESVDRCTLETVCMSVDDFLDSLCDKLVDLLRHSFIATQQSAYQKHVKASLKPGEFLVNCDFAENYSFVLQDEAQGFHWNNSSATIHPFIAYYRENGEEKHVSFVMISDSLQHNTVAVHLFCKKLIKFLQEKFGGTPKKMFYFSDGAASQYKNRKNFANLCNHLEDFGIEAQWDFFATSHGKGACDGVGGTVKRLAARASLQRPYDAQIMTPRQLYQWAKENIKTINFGFTTQQEHDREEELLKARFAGSRTIVGTQRLHSFVPSSQTKVLTRVYSFSQDMREEIVVEKVRSSLTFKEIKGFVTCVYDKKWWVACVLSSNADTRLVKLSFLHPNGPSTSFSYPQQSDILEVDASTILSTIDPHTATGRIYRLSQEEIKEADNKLQQWVKSHSD